MKGREEVRLEGAKAILGRALKPAHFSRNVQLDSDYVCHTGTWPKSQQKLSQMHKGAYDDYIQREASERRRIHRLQLLRYVSI